MLISMLKSQNIEFDSLIIIYFKMILNDQSSIIKYLIVIFFNCQQNETHVFEYITILKITDFRRFFNSDKIKASTIRFENLLFIEQFMTF